MGPRINISYCCRVTSCRVSQGSQNSMYRGQNQKLFKCYQKSYQQISLVILIQKEYSFTYLYRFVVIEEEVEGQDFGSTGVKHVIMLQICWQWSQNVRQVNSIENQNSLPLVRCFVTMVTQQRWSHPRKPMYMVFLTP